VLDAGEGLLDKTSSLFGFQEFGRSASAKILERGRQPVGCLVLVTEYGDCVRDDRHDPGEWKLRRGHLILPSRRTAL